MLDKNRLGQLYELEAALHFWAKLELHSQQVKAANARTLARMEAVKAVPPITVLDGETEDRLYEDWREWRAENGRSNRWQDRNGG